MATDTDRENKRGRKRMTEGKTGLLNVIERERGREGYILQERSTRES